MSVSTHNELRVLVVEDDLLVQRSIVRMLERNGITQVHAASSLDAALGTVVSVPLDVALVDLRLGRTDGRDVIESLRKTRPDLAVVLMTGGAEPELADHIDFLSKPFTPDELVTTVKRASSRPPRAHRPS